MSGLVDRLGRTGFAALTSVAWALPLAAWAGSVDLSPMDHTAYPWIAFALGLLLLAAWLVMLSRLRSVAVTERPRRLDFVRMSRSERRWSLAALAFALGALAWLNSAATVDWGPLLSALAAGKPGGVAFAAALAAFLAVMLVGVWFSWRRATVEFGKRAASSLTNVSPPRG